MNRPKNSIENFFVQAEDCTQTSLELMKLKAIDSLAEIISSLVVKFILLAMLALLIIILNIGIALWLGDLIGKLYYGFFGVAFLNGLFMLLLNSFLSEWLKVSISNFIIIQMLKHSI